MQGINRVGNPNELAANVWRGKRVNYNGTDQYGTVLRAFWQGPGKAIKLSVDWDVQTLWLGALTDSEHVTIVREINV